MQHLRPSAWLCLPPVALVRGTALGKSPEERYRTDRHPAARYGRSPDETPPGKVPTPRVLAWMLHTERDRIEKCSHSDSIGFGSGRYRRGRRCAALAWPGRQERRDAVED